MGSVGRRKDDTSFCRSVNNVVSSIHCSFSKQTSLVGSEAQDSITGLAFDGDFIWASTGPHVLKYIRGKEVCVVLAFYSTHCAHFEVKVSRLTNPLGTGINAPLVFGSQLLSLTEDGRNLLIWDASEEGECMLLGGDRAECL